MPTESSLYQYYALSYPALIVQNKRKFWLSYKPAVQSQATDLTSKLGLSLAYLRANSYTMWVLRTLELLNNCSFGGWSFFEDLLLCQIMSLAQGWGGRLCPCVAPDNPNPAREEDQIKWAPELVGRELKEPGKLGREAHWCTKGPPQTQEEHSLG